MSTSIIWWEARCPFCGKRNKLAISAKGYKAWTSGAMVQDAFPELGANEREFLITGMCAKCQDDVFGDNDDKEYSFEVTDNEIALLEYLDQY